MIRPITNGLRLTLQSSSHIRKIRENHLMADRMCASWVGKRSVSSKATVSEEYEAMDKITRLEECKQPWPIVGIAIGASLVAAMIVQVADVLADVL